MSNLVNLFERTIKASLDKVNTCFPAKVLAVGENGFIDVKPCCKLNGHSIEEINEVRLLQLQTPRAGIKIPAIVGDIVLVVVCQSSLDKFIYNGEEISRSFNITDSIALMGFYPQEQSPGMVIEFTEEGIKLEGKKINITNGEQDLKTILNDLIDRTMALEEAIKNGVPAPMDGGTAFKTSIVTALQLETTTFNSIKTKIGSLLT